MSESDSSDLQRLQELSRLDSRTLCSVNLLDFSNNIKKIFLFFVHYPKII